MRQISLAGSQGRSIRMPHTAQILIGAAGRVADSDADLGQKVKAIVQIISLVRPLRHIRCPQGVDTTGVEVRRFLWLNAEEKPLRWRICGNILIHRILILPIDNALITPLCQVIHRRRPAHIIIQAETRHVETIMTPVEIEPLAEHMRFSVRNILIGWKIGIKHLFFHKISSLNWKLIGFLKAELETRHGTIRASWRYEDSGIRYELEAPVPALVRLGGEDRYVMSGSYTFWSIHSIPEKEHTIGFSERSS